jgi:hypothetical protein
MDSAVKQSIYERLDIPSMGMAYYAVADMSQSMRRHLRCRRMGNPVVRFPAMIRIGFAL